MKDSTRYWVVESELDMKAYSCIFGKILSRHSKRITAENKAHKIAFDLTGNSSSSKIVVVKSKVVKNVGEDCCFSDVIIEEQYKTSIPELLRTLREGARQLRGVVFRFSAYEHKHKRKALVRLYRLLLKFEQKVIDSIEIYRLS